MEYSALTKTQKAAAFFVLIGADAAAALLRHFTDAEAEAIVREMALLPMVDRDVQKSLMEEFSAVIGDGVASALGGISFARAALEIARGPQHAANILHRAIPPSTSIQAVGELAGMESRQIMNLLKSEQPQTIAFILSYLEVPKAAEVVALLAVEVRDEVVQRLADMEPTGMELVGKVLENLNKHVGTRHQQTLQRRGGAHIAAQVLNRIESAIAKAVLSKIEERNAGLGAAIRRKMFTFEDFVRLTPTDLQKIVRNVETKDMALALKSARDPLKKAIFAGMSKRAGEGLREEIDMLGPVRVKDVEAARDRMIAEARALEESGEISLVQEDADAVVS